jgi:hypothetical protein
MAAQGYAHEKSGGLLHVNGFSRIVVVITIDDMARAWKDVGRRAKRT